MKYLLILIFGFVGVVGASDYEGIFSGKDASKVTLEELAKNVKPGQIVLMGEVHNSAAHHLNQVYFLNELEKQKVNFSVGMEFIEFPAQYYLDLYLLGAYEKDVFLKQARWSGVPFDFYINQVLLPTRNQGWTYALNTPREMTRFVAKYGLEKINKRMLKYVPENFVIGNDLYFERFKKFMLGESININGLQLASAGHISEDQLDNYFEAQSLWDDTMAANAIEIMRENPNTVLVIFVGEFHVQYGGGLKDRLIARGFNNVMSISQIEIEGPEDFSKRNKEILPHKKYGQRADYVWSIKSRPISSQAQ